MYTELMPHPRWSKRSEPAFRPSPFECAAVEDSDFFGRTFDAVVAVGLFFLLDAGIQRRLVAKVAAVLQSGGRLLFTARVKAVLGRCHDRKNFELTRPRGLPKRTGGRRHVARWNTA
jgi:hypothetical protein